MAKVTFQLLSHNGGYPINTLIKGSYTFVDDEENVIERANPAKRTWVTRNGNERSQARMYKFPSAAWEVDTVREKALYEFLRDHPHNIDSLTYKRDVLGYSKEMEDQGYPEPERAGFYLFKALDEAKERKARMADQYIKQQASQMLVEKVGVIDGDGSIKYVEGGKEAMNKTYFVLYGKNSNDPLAVFETLLQLADNAPQRLVDVLSINSEVYNHKVRVNKWIADGVLTEVDKLVYLNGDALGSRADVEAKSASTDENDIAFCKNLDGLAKPKLGRPKLGRPKTN